MTGRYSIRSGNHTVTLAGEAGSGLVAWERTLGDIFSEAGYATLCTGKWHIGDADGRWPTDHGFDEWYGPPHSYDEALWESDPWYDPNRDPVASMLAGRKGGKVVEKEKLTFELKRNIDVEYQRRLRARLFFYIVFLILVILMLLMIKPFFTVLVVSLISVIMLKPVYNFFLGLEWMKECKGLAASLMLIAVLVVLIIPIFLLVWLTVNQLSGVFEQLAALDLDAIIQSIQQSLAELPLVGEVQPLETSATETAQPLIGPIAQGLADFAVSLTLSSPGATFAFKAVPGRPGS
jgi:hypothetical protein